MRKPVSIIIYKLDDTTAIRFIYLTGDSHTYHPTQQSINRLMRVMGCYGVQGIKPSVVIMPEIIQLWYDL
jgi:hypothetical protein